MAFHTPACIAWGITRRSPIQDLTLSHEIEVICGRTRSNGITINTRGISRRTDKIRMCSPTQKNPQVYSCFFTIDNISNLFGGFNFKRKENKMNGRRCYDRTYPCSKGQFIKNTPKHITSILNIAGETIISLLSLRYVIETERNSTQRSKSTAQYRGFRISLPAGMSCADLRLSFGELCTDRIRDGTFLIPCSYTSESVLS